MEPVIPSQWQPDIGNLMASCNLCPRGCHADRSGGKLGRCHENAEVRIARASLHMWEEPCISGEEGSGTVFFSGCPLGCVYCQNHNIADGSNGQVITVQELTEVFLKLQKRGANNINLVTPTQFVPQITDALRAAKKAGLHLPIVYNTSSYERVPAIDLMDDLVDIYLPDLKYLDPELSTRYSGAEDYVTAAKWAIHAMFDQVGEPVFDDRGMMKRGVIVRHMVLPGCIEDSKRIIKYLWDTYGNDIWVSIMSQYTPLPELVAEKYPELNRRVSWDEYNEVVDYAADLGMTQAFVQEEESAKESFIPDFENFDVQEFLLDM